MTDYIQEIAVYFIPLVILSWIMLRNAMLYYSSSNYLSAFACGAVSFISLVLPILVPAFISTVEITPYFEGSRFAVEKLPSSVKEMLEMEANGNEVIGIKKEYWDGKTIYRAYVEGVDQDIEVSMGEDGKVIERKVVFED